MDKKKYILIFSLAFWLEACLPITPIPTQKTMLTFTPGATSTPSHTPTPSLTPLPTIPTPTATFDVASIVTVTPAPAEQCPKTIPVSNPDELNYYPFSKEHLPSSQEVEENILKILNTYGALPLAEELEKKDFPYHYYFYQDLTNDGIPELGLREEGFYIFGCKDGKYQILIFFLRDPNLYVPSFTEIGDYNQNGIDEIAFLVGTGSQGSMSFRIYEWNNDNLSNLLEADFPEYPDSGTIRLQATGELHFEDIEGDGIYELIANSGIPVWSIYRDFLPWRNERIYYTWNGTNYVPSKREFSIPDVEFITIQEFRFQSIQDGDLATSQGEYAKALDFYQRAIYDSSLSGYSLEIRKNLQENWDAHISNNPTPTPYPDDPNEYPQLASYAYYRIMLLQIIQGNLAEAEKTYNTLQEEFAKNQYGAPYAEMARDFWQAYQQNQNMTEACGAAITYAALHPEILIPLGSDYHGWQSHTYEPAEVCPFR